MLWIKGTKNALKMILQIMSGLRAAETEEDRSALFVKAFYVLIVQE
jgi:hypothetical protein